MTTPRKPTEPTDTAATKDTPMPTPVGGQGEIAPARPQTDVATGQSTDAEIASFVARMKSAPLVNTGDRGRLVFAMDATMSRAPTWDMALALQSEMFDAVKSVGGLDVQLVYFRGFGECRASKWVNDPQALARLMTTVECQGGRTQIRKVLSHVHGEAAARRVNALVYVGDCMEEDVDQLAARAGELSLLGVPVFLFQEGHDAIAARAFSEIARLTRGAHLSFDKGSARQLRELLTAVAVYAAGGRRALEQLRDGRGADGARKLLAKLPTAKGQP